MVLLARPAARTRFIRIRKDGHSLDTSPDVAPFAESADDEIGAFGAGFTAAMRRYSALNPRPLEIQDVVDVFSGAGQFLYRGTVASRNADYAQITVVQSQTGAVEQSETVTARIENCRFADAAPPSATLEAWESARGVNSSRAPR